MDIPPPESEPRRPWHWIEGHETQREHAMFSHWLHGNAADASGYRAVAKAFGVSLESVQLLAAIKLWSQRRDAHSAWIQTIQDTVVEREAYTIGRAKAATMRLVVGALEEAAASIAQERQARDLRGGVSAIQPADALAVAMKAPRAVAALAALEPPAADAADDLDLSRLSLDELMQYRQLQMRATRQKP